MHARINHEYNRDKLGNNVYKTHEKKYIYRFIYFFGKENYIYRLKE